MAATAEGAASLVALHGPTGLGKTEIAIALARRLGGEIVSADSMQVYRGLAIVTNQPDQEQLACVPHYLVAIVDPDREFSVAEYARLAHAAIDGLVTRDVACIVEGGSGLYLRAALGGLTFGAPPSAARSELEQAVAVDPAGQLARLRRLDPATAERIDAGNPRRLVRALESVFAQGSPLSAEQVERLWAGGAAGAARRSYRLFALDVDRAALRERVEARVDRMVDAGLVAEVRSAAERPGGLSRTVRQAIGVAEILAHLDDELSLDEAVSRIKARTRRYVRRQLTWMRKLPDADIIPTSDRSPDDVAHDIRGRLFSETS